MLTVEEALEAVLEQAGPLPGDAVPLEAALHCVLDEDVAADIDLPPFDKSLVDGFAVRSDDLMGQDRGLRVGEVITAGQTPTRPLGPREAAVIMTGAPVPPGCDAVVMHERTRSDGGIVWVDEPEVRIGHNILPRPRDARGRADPGRRHAAHAGPPGGPGIGRPDAGQGRAASSDGRRLNRRRAGRAGPTPGPGQIRIQCTGAARHRVGCDGRGAADSAG